MLILSDSTHRKLEYELSYVIQYIESETSRYFFLGYCLGIAWTFQYGDMRYEECMEFISRFSKYRDLRHLPHIERFRALFGLVK